MYSSKKSKRERERERGKEGWRVRVREGRKVKTVKKRRERA